MLLYKSPFIRKLVNSKQLLRNCCRLDKIFEQLRSYLRRHTAGHRRESFLSATSHRAAAGCALGCVCLSVRLSVCQCVIIS